MFKNEWVTPFVNLGAVVQLFRQHRIRGRLPPGDQIFITNGRPLFGMSFRRPIALWPSSELGEAEVWSGCCTINGKGEPMAFYTSIAPGRPAKTHAEQWAAVGDKDLITWRKSPANPVLTEKLHNGAKIYEWRDPFVFKHRDRTFM